MCFCFVFAFVCLWIFVAVVCLFVCLFVLVWGERGISNLSYTVFEFSHITHSTTYKLLKLTCHIAVRIFMADSTSWNLVALSVNTVAIRNFFAWANALFGRVTAVLITRLRTSWKLLTLCFSNWVLRSKASHKSTQKSLEQSCTKCQVTVKRIRNNQPRFWWTEYSVGIRTRCTNLVKYSWVDWPFLFLPVRFHSCQHTNIEQRNDHTAQVRSCRRPDIPAWTYLQHQTSLLHGDDLAGRESEHLLRETCWSVCCTIHQLTWSVNLLFFCIINFDRRLLSESLVPAMINSNLLLPIHKQIYSTVRRRWQVTSCWGQCLLNYLFKRGMAGIWKTPK